VEKSNAVTSDGARSYEWDAADRLVSITYAGTEKRSEFSYDGLGRRVRIVEKEAGAVTADRRFLWDGFEIAEERDATNAVTKRYFPQGFQTFDPQLSTTASYYYTRDHLGSIREVGDSAGNVRARYGYTFWGSRTRLSGDLDADFGFTGHYHHAPSGLTLAPYRAYSAEMGRWLSRDPIGEEGGLNLYGYAGNSPTNRTDPLGLWYALNPATWFDGQGYQGGRSEFYRYSDLEQAAGATLDGIIPFADPFADAGAYDKCDEGSAFSRAAGAFARDAYLVGRIPNIGQWAKSPRLYEIGSKTVPKTTWEVIKDLSPAQRGAALLRMQGWRAYIPQVTRAYGETIRTGLTPGGWLLLGGVGQAVDTFTMTR
jgi:RHS repeat-associated protein